MKDRYRNWYTKDDYSMRAAIPIMAPRVKDLEALVLQDLAQAKDDTEKVEILDSYSLASQRRYRNDLRRAMMDYAQQFLRVLLGPALEVNLPEPQEPWHSRVGMVSPTEQKY